MEKAVEFDHEIKEVRRWKDLYILCLRAPNNNIYAVNSEGKVIWQIQDIRDFYSPEATGDDAKVRLNYTDGTNYNGIHMIREGNIRTIDRFGFVYIVDPRTGKIIRRDGWTK